MLVPFHHHAGASFTELYGRAAIAFRSLFALNNEASRAHEVGKNPREHAPGGCAYRSVQAKQDNQPGDNNKTLWGWLKRGETSSFLSFR